MTRFSSDYARNLRESARPGLYRNLVGIYAPILTGHTGLILPDLSDHRMDLDLTNMAPATDWVVDRDGNQFRWAGYVLDLDGGDDKLLSTIASNPFSRIDATEFTIILRIRANNTTFNGTAEVLVDTCDFNTNNGGLWMTLDDRGANNAVNGIGIQFNTDNTVSSDNRRLGVNSVIGASDTWHHICVSYSSKPSGNPTDRWMVDGAEVSPSVRASVDGNGQFLPSSTVNSAKLAIGGRNTSAGFEATMRMAYALFFDRQLLLDEMLADYLFPLVALEKRRKVFRGRVPAAAGTNPHNPLGHPLRGPFGGPIG